MSKQLHDIESANPRVELGSNAGAVIREHVEATYPEEACGGLLGVGYSEHGHRVLEAIPVASSRTGERERRYLISPDDVLQLEQRAEAARLQVIGYYHSHPDAPAIPSLFDRDHAWPWYVYLIISVSIGQVVDVKAWRLADNREAFHPIQFDPSTQLAIEQDDL